MKKVFRCYDNDDDGKISCTNLIQCAEVLDMSSQINDINLKKMIELADPSNKGYVE